MYSIIQFEIQLTYFYFYFLENEFLNNIKHNSLNLKTIEQEEIAFNPENFNTPPNVRETKSNSKKEENIKRNKIEIASHISIIEGKK